MFLEEPKIELTRSPKLKPNLLKNQRKYQKFGSRKEIFAAGRVKGPKTRALGPIITAIPRHYGGFTRQFSMHGLVSPSRIFLAYKYCNFIPESTLESCELEFSLI